MIKLTRLGGEEFYINPLQIEYVEIIPETKIVMANGKYHLVQEESELVKSKIKEFFHEIITG